MTIWEDGDKINLDFINQRRDDMTQQEISNAKYKHQFSVEVRNADWSKHESIYVDANNRNQAARIVEKLGWTVCSVNMVG